MYRRKEVWKEGRREGKIEGEGYTERGEEGRRDVVKRDSRKGGRLTEGRGKRVKGV